MVTHFKRIRKYYALFYFHQRGSRCPPGTSRFSRCASRWTTCWRRSVKRHLSGRHKPSKPRWHNKFPLSLARYILHHHSLFTACRNKRQHYLKTIEAYSFSLTSNTHVDAVLRSTSLVETHSDICKDRCLINCDNVCVFSFCLFEHKSYNTVYTFGSV